MQFRARLLKGGCEREKMLLSEEKKYHKHKKYMYFNKSLACRRSSKRPLQMALQTKSQMNSTFNWIRTPWIVKGNKSLNLVWFKWGSQRWGSWMCSYLASVERLLTNEEYRNISLDADVSLSLIGREKNSLIPSKYGKKAQFGLVWLDWFHHYL